MYTNEYKQPCKAKFGNLTDLITPELISLCRDAKHIVIYGHARSGKSLITKCLSEKLDNRKFVFSDWYMYLGFQQNMYALLAIIRNNTKQLPLIIEGIQTCRLLRKGIEKNVFNPEIVIHIVCNYETIVHGYKEAGEAHKLRNNLVKNWNTMFDKIFFDWYDMIKYSENKPKIIKIDTSVL